MVGTRIGFTGATSFLSAAAAMAIGLSACGGGGGGGSSMPIPKPTPTDFNLQAGYVNLVNSGLSAKVTLSGTLTVNATAMPFTGTGTYTLSPGVTATFNNTSALSQTQAITGTVTAAGQSVPFSVSVVDYYASAGDAFLGQVDPSSSSTAGEYDVASSPITYPSSVVGGSSGTLGTINRYTDSSMSVPLGTTTLSYSVTAPVDPGSPVSVKLTNQIYDTQQNLTETDVTTYTLTSTKVLSFVSATAQSGASMLTVTAQ